MFRAYGLASHIAANRRRSIYLLASFVVLLQALLYSFSLIFQAAQGGDDVGEIMARAWRGMAYVSPIGLAAAAVWFAIAWKWHSAMIGMATHARAVSGSDVPQLHAALEELCISRGITMPQLGIIETPALNAFASGLRERDYRITVTRGLLDTLDKRELQAVLGHELTHIRNRDVQMLVIAVIFAGLFAFVGDVTFRKLDFPFGSSPKFPSSSRGNKKGGGAAVIIVIAIALLIIALSWGASVLIRFAISRSREFMADAGAVELTKDPDAMISALRKISVNAAIKDMPSRMHAFFIETPAVRDVSSFFATHPHVEERIEALVRFAAGRDAEAR